MAMPQPFNSVEDLLSFTSFEHGAGNGAESVEQGTFAFSQFESALRRTRNEIYRKTGKRQNDEFAEDRTEELREAELWLATARLFPLFGERIAVKTVDANMAGIAEIQIGADTPPPSGPGSKAEFWAKFMSDRYRALGLMLLESPSTRYQVTVGTDKWTERYACLSREKRYGLCSLGECK